MNTTTQHDCNTEPDPDAAEPDEALRCFECRRLWPRVEMRWGTRPAGPVWFPRTIRVLRCPDCLPN